MPWPRTIGALRQPLCLLVTQQVAVDFDLLLYDIEGTSGGLTGPLTGTMIMANSPYFVCYLPSRMDPRLQG